MEKNRGKYFAKVFLILAAVFVVVVVGILAFIVHSLPSAHKISSAILNPPKTLNLEPVQDSIQTQKAVIPAPPVVQGGQAPSPTAKVTTVTETQTLASRSGLQDLIDPNRPISNFCPSLKNAKVAQMSPRETNQAFKRSLTAGTEDPRAQALKPLFRYMFRLPAVQNLITTIDQAAQNQEDDFFQKASFYGQVVAAFSDLNSHRDDLESIADRSYLFFKLNAAVAAHPELLNDQRLQQFCSDTENAFNTNQPVQFDQEKKNFERLLTELNVDANTINYNPSYKTHFDVSLGEQNLSITGGWLEELFKK